MVWQGMRSLAAEETRDGRKNEYSASFLDERIKQQARMVKLQAERVKLQAKMVKLQAERVRERHKAFSDVDGQGRSRHTVIRSGLYRNWTIALVPQSDYWLIACCAPEGVVCSDTRTYRTAKAAMDAARNFINLYLARFALLDFFHELYGIGRISSEDYGRLINFLMQDCQ